MAFRNFWVYSFTRNRKIPNVGEEEVEISEAEGVAFGNLYLVVKAFEFARVDGDEDAISLFTRLNIGKIPRTSGELVKAIFLSRDNTTKMDKEKQEEISLQWDNIEKRTSS